MPHASLKILPGVDTNKTPALNEAAISQSQLIRFISDRTIGGLVQKLGGWTKYPTPSSSSIGSVVRNLWGWEDTNSNSYLAIGAEGKGPIVVTGASGTGSTATLTYTGPFQFPVGFWITVTGVNPAGYNGTYAVTASTNTSVSFANATTATYVSGGAIAGGGNSLLVANSGNINNITPQKLVGDVAPSFTTTSGSNKIQVNITASNAQNVDTIDIQTQISVGGLVLFGQYQCYQDEMPMSSMLEE